MYTFSIYIMGLVLEWLKENGGAEGMQERNTAKATALYEFIDRSNGFYKWVFELINQPC